VTSSLDQSMSHDANLAFFSFLFIVAEMLGSENKLQNSRSQNLLISKDIPVTLSVTNGTIVPSLRVHSVPFVTVSELHTFKGPFGTPLRGTLRVPEPHFENDCFKNLPLF